MQARLQMEEREAVHREEILGLERELECGHDKLSAREMADLCGVL